MNGWERLGIVVWALVAVPASLIVYESTSSETAYYSLDETAQTFLTNERLTAEQLEVVLKGEALYQARDQLQNCVSDNLEVREVGENRYFAKCRISFRYWGEQVALAIIIPFAIIWLFGHSIAWVRRGFKSS